MFLEFDIDGMKNPSDKKPDRKMKTGSKQTVSLNFF